LGESCEEFLALGGVDGGIDAEVAGEDAIDITIDNGCGQAKGDGADGGSGIVAYAFQRPDALDGIREMPKGDNLTGCEVEVARTAVIAESLPLAEHFVLSGGSEILYRWPSAHETLPVVPALLDLRLLEDDL